jgi:hypothetical protein
MGIYCLSQPVVLSLQKYWFRRKQAATSPTAPLGVQSKYVPAGVYHIVTRIGRRSR